MRRTVLLAVILVLANLAGVLHAGLVARPAKTCGQTTYVGEVANGCTTIKAAEVDADFNAILTGGVNNVETANINAAGLGTAAYANGSVTEPKLAANSVNSSKIVDGTIVNVDIADGTIQGPKLADAPNGITTVKINDNAVTRDKIAIGNAVRNSGGAAGVSVGATASPGGGEVTIATIAGFQSLGGFVLLTGHAALTWNTLGAGSANIIIRVKRDGVPITGGTARYDVETPGVSALPIPSHAGVIGVVAAGTYTYTVTMEILGGSAGVVITNSAAASAGAYTVVELS